MPPSGRRGTNHGVELYRYFVQYAYKQLERFMKSPAMDVFDFCEPVFVQGDAQRNLVTYRSDSSRDGEVMYLYVRQGIFSTLHLTNDTIECIAA